MPHIQQSFEQLQRGMNSWARHMQQVVDNKYRCMQDKITLEEKHLSQLSSMRDDMQKHMDQLDAAAVATDNSNDVTELLARQWDTAAVLQRCSVLTVGSDAASLAPEKTTPSSAADAVDSAGAAGAAEAFSQKCGIFI